ncbi:MAG: hypothetical protein QXS48_01405 [Candidatus Aenigmatarchaeota archaeon]
MPKSLVQEMFQEAKKFVRLHNKKGASDVEINEILRKKPFVQGEFIIDTVVEVNSKYLEKIGVSERSYDYKSLQQATKEWKKVIREREGLVPSANTYPWYFGSTKLNRKISLTDKKIENFGKKYKLECVYCTEKDKWGEKQISHVCLVSPLIDLDEATLYTTGYYVGTTLDLNETRDGKLYESIGKEIYGLKEKTWVLGRKINSLRRRWRGYWEEIDRRMDEALDASSIDSFEEE